MKKVRAKRANPTNFRSKPTKHRSGWRPASRRCYAIERQNEPDVFNDDIKIDDITLKNLVLHLESVNLSATDLDTKGVAFEQFMDGFFKGDFGQYFTPRNIIAFAIQMLDIKADDTVMDPACGSGGFLLHALDHVRKLANEYYDEDSKEHFNYWHSFAEKRLYGIEINEEIARVAKMNMIVHDDGHTNIIGNDALEPLAALGRKSQGLFDILGLYRETVFNAETGKNEEVIKRDEAKGFTKIPTNPPFGAVIKDELHSYLSGYDLSRYLAKSGGKDEDDAEDTSADPTAGKKAIKQRASVKTEVIYCERVWQLLRPGGKAGVVLPDGLLTNASLQGVRDWLLGRFKVLAVVSLPQFAFAHFGAGVKSSVVFLEKRKPNVPASGDEAIFMAMAENIGYDATGRSTYQVEVLSEAPGQARAERQRCDLLDWHVTFDWMPGEGKKPGHWSERHRHVIPGSGLLGQYAAFKRDPEAFFV
ncbi:N-6 DNA methylase [Candidatus Methylospira mobilis]|uniref:HsdM family class I SAM-dependent methyltransferase n=1 Tax=Candidatus Methylospira mobilis TaxID=1808979 RepID=UPI0028E52C71|nr:N-6 DNA methylase [Candidatus Methylospira mobilis]WNV06135.1 N-6 DNA methylase [Candidatus Methylospira mobilis]